MTKIINPPVGGVKVFPNKEPTVEKKETKKSAYDVFLKSKDIWGYGREANKIVQGVLKGSGDIYHDYKPLLSGISDKMSLAVILDVPFAIESTVSGVKKIASGAKIKDYGGVSIAGMGALLNVGDSFSGLLSFINAIFKVTALPAIKVLGKISPLLSMSLCSLSIVSKSYQLVNHAKFRCKITKIDTEKEETIQNVFKSMIAKDSRLSEIEAKNLDSTKAIKGYKAKKAAILNRALNADLVERVKSATENVLTKDKLTEDDKNDLKKTVRSASKLNVRKIFTCLISIGITGGTLATLVVALLNAAPILIVGAAFTFFTVSKLGLKIYENKFLNRGL